MALTAVGIAVTVAAAATSGYQAKRAGDRQDQAQDRAAKEKAMLAEREKANQQMAAQKMLADRRRALAMSQQGRYGTIRTSPLGVPKAPAAVGATGGNTVLGAA